MLLSDLLKITQKNVCEFFQHGKIPAWAVTQDLHKHQGKSMGCGLNLIELGLTFDFLFVKRALTVAIYVLKIA